MDPIQQLIAQLSQQYAGGVGPIQRGVDPYNTNLNSYADVNLGGQQKRLMYQPGMQDGNTGAFGPGRYMTDLSGPMVNPTTGKQGAVRGFFGEDGSFQGAEWWDDEQSWIDKVLSVAPVLVLGAAALGAGGFLPGMGGEAAAGAAGGAAGGTGLTAGATQAAGGAGIFDTMKSLATYAGPAASLLSSAQTVGAVNDLQAGMPALRQPEVPPVPAAQAASNPITSVLGRNREANRNRTMLTGPRGVNMESVRVGGNSLLGM